MTAGGPVASSLTWAGDRYRLDARIATGGMGEVWRGTDTVLDRDVAVKVLKAEYADDPTFRARFQTEARHAAALHHPNVASVFDFGEVSDSDGSGRPRPFLVMELVPGQPLSALLLGGEPMPPHHAAALVAQAAEAIAAAHALDVVHRDVKPANLLVTPDGTVKITDFGIARATDAVPLTETGQIVGTPHYLAPEQAEGRPATRASDIYALGVVLFECLAGHRPFVGETSVGTALAHLREPVPPLPGNIPEHLRAVVHRALAKDPDQRFASAADLATALRGGAVPVSDATQVIVPAALPTAAATAAAPVGARRRVPGWAPWAAAAAVLIVLAAAIGLFDDGPQVPAAGSTTDPSPSPSPSRSSAPPAAPSLVRLREAAYVGLDHDRVHADLRGRGFRVTETTQANPGGHQAGSVAGVDPHGRVRPHARVTLTVWSAPPPPEPEEDGAEAPAQPPEPHGKAKGHDKPDKHHKGKPDKHKPTTHGKAKGKKH